MMSAKYSAEVYDRLLPFQETKERFTSHHQYLQTLGHTICEHALQDYIGISLLHKHFQLSKDERLIEQFYGDQTQVSPQVTGLTQELHSYLWKLSYDETAKRDAWFPLEFYWLTNQPRKLNIADHTCFLQSIARIIADLNLTETFGITWLHRGWIRVKSDEMLVETTSQRTRTLTWSALPKAALTHDQLTPTAWQFDGNGEIIAIQTCGHCYHSDSRRLICYTIPYD